MRNSARKKLEKARELIARGDICSLRYACLELRFCIEYLTYANLQSYIAEVPDHAVRKWTPKQVISTLLEVDPNADKSSTVSIGLEKTQGIPAEDMQMLGEDIRFSLKWANSRHNALGNFLHAPTLYQIEKSEFANEETIHKKATEIAEELDKILSSPIFNVNFGQFYEFTCTCGTQIKRREGSFTEEQGIACPNSKCGATYDVLSQGDSTEIEFKVREAEYKCPLCEANNYVGLQCISHNSILSCAGCNAKFKVEERFHLRPVE